MGMFFFWIESEKWKYKLKKKNFYCYFAFFIEFVFREIVKALPLQAQNFLHNTSRIYWAHSAALVYSSLWSQVSVWLVQLGHLNGLIE